MTWSRWLPFGRASITTTVQCARRVLIRRANGEIKSVSVGGFSQPKPEPGDEIMVLPEPNVKNLQLAKSLAQILFQLAVTTSVILDL